MVACAVFVQLALAGIASAASCNDNWTNASGGSWSTAANWSAGVPGSGSDVCITLAGNYTVTLVGNPGQVDSLTLGSSSGATTQTLAVDGVPGQNSTLSFATNSTVAATGQLTLDSQAGGGFADLLGASSATLSNSGTFNSQVESAQLDFLEANLTNTGTVDVKTGELRQDQATTTTNSGTFKVDVGATPGYTITSGSASFVNNTGGSVADNGAITLTGGSSWSQHGGSESGNAVSLFNTCSLVDNGNGSSGQFDVLDTVGVSGTIAAGETLSVLGTPGHNSTANLVTAVTNNGTVVLDSQASGGLAQLQGRGLTNNGTLNSQVEGGNSDFLEVNLTNNAGHTVDVKSGELRQDTATTTTNNGTFKVGAGASPGYTITNGSASFVNNGSVSNGGAISLTNGASWSQLGGSETGAAVQLFNTCSLTDAGTGSSGQFDLVGAVSLSGTIASGESVSVLGTPGNNSSANLTTAITNNGKIVLDSQSGGGLAEISGASVTNKGTFDSQVEGSNTDFLESKLNNAGTVEVISGELRQDHATTTTNNATFLVDSGTNPGAFNITSGSASFLNDAGATVTDSGSIALSGASWSQIGGSETGGTVALGNTSSLIDNGTGSSGKFSITNSVSVSGAIASGETLSVLGIPGVNSNANLVGAVTNKGTIVLDSQASGGNAAISGNPLTNNGTIDSQVEGASLDFLEVNLTNNASGTVEVKSGELRQDQATTTTNNGTFIVDAGASPGFTLPTSVASFVNNGSVSNGGAITLSGGATWSAHGGSETGAPVTLQSSSALVDTGTGSSGQFTLLDTAPVSGTIAAGETVTVIGVPGRNSSMSLSAPGVTNSGTIVLDSQSGGGFARVEGSPLTNNGTFNTQVEGSGAGDFLEANLANAGTVEVKTGALVQDGTTTTTNDGNVILDVGAQFNLTSGGAVFNQQSDGTMTFDISGASSFGTLNLTAGTFNLNGGTANPILQGGYAPAVGTEFDVITGPHGAGTYTTVKNDFTGDYAHAGFVGLIRDRDSTSTAVTSSTNPSTVGQSVTFTATITPALGGVGNPTGTVTFFDNGTSIGIGSLSTTGGVTTATLTTSTLAAGTHPITASYGGDTNYKPSPVSSPALSQVVNKAGTSTAVTSSLNPSTVGQSVTLTATITHTSGSANPTGTVTFLDNGSSIGTGSLSTTGGVTTATLTTSTLTQGSHPITASYGGDSNYNGSTSSPALSQVVNAKAATGTSTAVKSSVNPSTVGQSVTFTATVTPGVGGTGNPTGTVTFLDNGSSIGTGSLSTTGGVTTATLTTSTLAAGTHPITASYGGDSNYNGSTSSPALSQVVNKASSSTGLTSSMNPSNVGQPVTFTATITPGAGGTGNPTGTVTFLDNGSSIGTGSLSTTGGVSTATLTTSTLSAGTHPITASYGGDSNYNGSASSPALSQVVNPVSTGGCTMSSMSNSTMFSASGQSIHIENALDSVVSRSQHLVLRSLTGAAQYFALTKLTGATCSDNTGFPLGPGSSFNTITADGPGSFGAGQFQTTTGFTLHIVIGDLGDSGTTDNPLVDHVSFTITSAKGVVVWTGSGNLTGGSEEESG